MNKRMSEMKFWAVQEIFILAVTASFLWGCEPKVQPEPPRPVESETVMPSIVDLEFSRDDESPVVGRWEVIDYELTPVSAVEESQAMGWLGQLVVYSEGAVGFEAELCLNPSFEEHAELFAEYFSDYEVDPMYFGIESAEVDVISIGCNGSAWTAPGAELIHVRGDSIVIVYDGVFLSMEPYQAPREPTGD